MNKKIKAICMAIVILGIVATIGIETVSAVSDVTNSDFTPRFAINIPSVTYINQQFTISVTNRANGYFIAGANVRICISGTSTCINMQTNDRGYVLFTALHTNYQIWVSAPGYQDAFTTFAVENPTSQVIATPAPNVATTVPTAVPTVILAAVTTPVPTAVPTVIPAAVTTVVPTVIPTAVSTVIPTPTPTPTPTPLAYKVGQVVGFNLFEYLYGMASGIYHGIAGN